MWKNFEPKIIILYDLAASQSGIKVPSSLGPQMIRI